MVVLKKHLRDARGQQPSAVDLLGTSYGSCVLVGLLGPRSGARDAAAGSWRSTKVANVPGDAQRSPQHGGFRGFERAVC